MQPRPPRPPLFPYTTLFRSVLGEAVAQLIGAAAEVEQWHRPLMATLIAGFGLLVALWWLTLRYGAGRSEEHTSELQSRRDLVCRLLLEKKKRITTRVMKRRQ